MSDKMSLREGAKEFLNENYSTMDIAIKKAQKILNTLDYDIEEIKSFTKSLQEITKGFDNKNYVSGLGIYLSLAINKKIEDKLEIEMPIELDFVGMRLREGKKLIVKGDVRDLAGYEMKGGNLLIKGEADNNLGNYMEDGYIECESAEDLVGIEMKDSTIKVRGNVGKLTGHDMKSGEILIEGYESISPKFNNGKIKTKNNVIEPN